MPLNANGLFKLCTSKARSKLRWERAGPRNNELATAVEFWEEQNGGYKCASLMYMKLICVGITRYPRAV